MSQELRVLEDYHPLEKDPCLKQEIGPDTRSSKSWVASLNKGGLVVWRLGVSRLPYKSQRLIQVS